MADQAEKDTVISNPAGLMEGSPCVHSGEFQEKATPFRNFRQLNAPRLKPRTQRLCRVGCIGQQLSFTCENMHDISPPSDCQRGQECKLLHQSFSYWYSALWPLWWQVRDVFEEQLSPRVLFFSGFHWVREHVPYWVCAPQSRAENKMNNLLSKITTFF